MAQITVTMDPNLISSIEIEKSGSLAGDIKTSVGGGIAIRTIGIDDVVAPDEKFGVSKIGNQQ